MLNDQHLYFFLSLISADMTFSDYAGMIDNPQYFAKLKICFSFVTNLIKNSFVI